MGVDLSKCKTRALETDYLFSFAEKSSDPIVILDERGKDVTSRQVATQMARWRDDGAKTLHIVIGGADGFEPDHLPQGTVKWCLGRMTCLLYTSPSPRDQRGSRMPSSA